MKARVSFVIATVCLVAAPVQATPDCVPITMARLWFQKQAPREARPSVTIPGVGEVRDPKLLRPPTAAEIDSLIRVLEPLKGVRPDGPELERLERRMKREGLSPRRTAVVLDDVTALLVAVHARENLKLIPDLPGLPDKSRGFIKESLLSVLDCVPTGFAGRIGPQELEEVMTLVERQRHRLDPVILTERITHPHVEPLLATERLTEPGPARPPGPPGEIP
jgi:hypothetical protein